MTRADVETAASAVRGAKLRCECPDDYRRLQTYRYFLLGRYFFSIDATTT